MEASARDTARICVWDLFGECDQPCNSDMERNYCIPGKLWATCGLPAAPKLLDIWIPAKLAGLL